MVAHDVPVDFRGSFQAEALLQRWEPSDGATIRVKGKLTIDRGVSRLRFSTTLPDGKWEVKECAICR